MALPKNQKKWVIKLPTCHFCGAVGKHYAYQCPKNPKNFCKYCKQPGHSSLMCQDKPRRALKKESDSAKSKRTQTSREWFKLNPPNKKGVWYCYLQVSPDCPIKLTRSTIRLEHRKSKARHPELRYDVTNLAPACDPCNKLKGSLNDDEVYKLGSARLIESKKPPAARG